MEDSAVAEEGRRRFGDYELISEIAHGGMGVVWRARQDGLDRDVALKMILAGQLADSTQVIRFYTEARAAARLDHPNIVPLYEIGDEDGRHFYTMRLMEGGSLAGALKASRRMPPERSARLVATVANAVHFAHQRGVLHRDLKPSNILLDAEGNPHVADFGLARLLDSASEVSASGMAVGTPAYMAPEQASGAASEVTSAADVYALGAVLYEVLTGAPPFLAETPLKTLRLVTEAEPVLPRARDPSIPRDLEVICLKCLQKSSDKRYASAAELARDLERWLAHEPILARPASAGERLVSWAQRKPELAMAFAALFVLLAVALAITLPLLVKVRRESDARATALRLEESQRLALQSLAVVRENPGQALLLALEAAARAPSLSANNAMFTALEANRERRRLLGHSKMVRFASFSPDGRHVATASHDMTARIWSVETGAASVILRGHQGTVKTAGFSPDGTRVLTSSDDATARIWDSGSGVEILKLAGHEHPLRSASFSPDGTRVLTVGQQTARLWDARSGASMFVIAQHVDGVSCAKFSPDGRRFVTGGRDGIAKVWDTETGSLLASLPGHTERVIDVAFSADGLLLATASDSEARVWDASTYEELSVARGHAHGIYAVALTSDGGTLATGSEDFTARVWDARTGRQIHVLPHEHKVVSVEISRDDELLLTASYDNSARVWDLESGKLVAEMRGHAAPLYHAAFSPDCRHAVTSSVDFTARLWTVRPSLPIALGPWGTASTYDADVAADEKRVVEAYLGLAVARVLELESRREIARLEGHTKRIRTVRFNFAGDKIASGSEDTTARLWDARNGKALHTMIGHEAAVTLVSFSPDGRHVLTVSHDHSARLWSVEDGVQAAVYQTKQQFRSATFAPDSDRIALADTSGWLRIGRISSGELSVFEVDDPIVCADFGPHEGHIAVTLGTTRAQIRRLDDRSVVAELILPARAAFLISSPDRRWLATLAEDATLRLWETATREEHVEIKRVGGRAGWVHFPANGRHIVVKWVAKGVRDEDATYEVMIYPLEILGAARGAKFGDLTPDERDHFQVGSAEERRAHREGWTGGHIFGKGAEVAR
ncbi:MAG: protein kinase [Planctomycetes bacterium]|nr:protein kinase [Planctomycetota bacterium]